LVAGTTTAVRLNLHRNGQATVDVNFDDDGGSGTTCNPGFADCDGDAANGCETALSTVNNCGACGVVCASAPGAVAQCSSGVCTSACVAGQADCNGNSADGCETNLTSDVSNCGSCGGICPVPAHATAVCVGGVCGIGGCASGFADCNGSSADGCEVNLTSNHSNCGSCGSVCASNEQCVGGICEPNCISPCP
jgi:hypothetical protein